jgi:SAM-dependent methyltransferase
MARRDCPSCGAADSEPVLHWSGLPAFQNVVFTSADAARAIPRGDMALACCTRCAFLFNAAYQAIEYSAGYDNRQSDSPRFRAHLETMARRTSERHDLAGRRIVEIGCGDGAFLRRLLELSPRARGVGFDPAYVGPSEDLAGRARFAPRRLDDAHVPHPDDVLVCRHVLGHVADPVEFLRSIRRAAGNRVGARLLFEVQCAAWVLRRRSIWDIGYEQCSYFVPESIRAAMSLAGWRVAELEHVFDGQYLWGEAVADDPDAEPRVDAAATVAAARAFGERDARIRARRTDEVKAATPTGAAIWGAATKGVLFAHLTDPDAERLRFAIDLNVAKQGKHMAATGLPIVSPQALVSGAVGTIFLMNPAYRPEVEVLLRELGVGARLVDVVD